LIENNKRIFTGFWLSKSYDNERRCKMDGEISLDFKAILEIIKKRLWILVVITLTSTGISCVLSFWLIHPIYEAKTTILIGKSIEGEDDRLDYDDILLYQKVVKTYMEIAKSRLVAEKTINSLSKNITIDDFLESISVSTQQDTQIMVIKTKNTSAVEAADIVNCLAQSFIEECQKLLPTGNAKVVDKAFVPEEPVIPKKKTNIIIGFFSGILISVVIIFIINYFDNTIKTDEELERYTSIAVLGVIPREYKNKRY
jgi:capsular polysaccharide biosynthesis protein